MIKGKQREDKGFSPQVGIFEAEVLAINPTLDELNTIYGGNSGRDEEPEYTKNKEVKIGEGEDEETIYVDSLMVKVIGKDKRTKTLVNAQFYLEDRERKNKDGSKKQYINTRGTTTWAESEDDLPTWFTKDVDYRVAKVGEDELYDFVNKWSSFDFKDPEFSIDLEFDKLITGDVSELKALVEQNKGRTFSGLQTIRTKTVDGEEKTFPTVYTKRFMPGYSAKVFATKKFTPEVIEALRDQAQRRKDDKTVPRLKPHEQFVVDVTDEEYGIKDFFKLTLLSDYDPSENMIESDAVHSEDGSDF